MKYFGDDMRLKALIPLALLMLLCIAPFPISANGNTLAYTGTAGPDSSVGDYTDTWADLMTDYDGVKDTAGESYVILNFTIAPFTHLMAFNYSVNGAAYFDDDGSAELWVYDWTAYDWVYLDDLGLGAGAWANGSISGSQYSDGTQIALRANSTDSDGGSGVAVIIAWLHNIEGGDWHNVGTGEFFIDVEGWNVVGLATFYFDVPMDLWGFNRTLIILGLIMIPSSSIYLVRGGRKDLSRDKFFFVLVIFFAGCALFIGGIMP